MKRPIPKDFKALRGFLGLTGYYCKFMKDYRKLVAPLIALLKKDAFKWDSTTKQAFDNFKIVVTIVLILVMPNFSKPFIVEAKASEIGLGVVLIQEGRPIAYCNHVLALRARQTSVYEQELMAIMFAVKRWRHYLMGHRFSIRTYQKTLKYLLEQWVLDKMQQKWDSKLMGFKYEIQYNPGIQNKATNAISMRGNDLQLQAFSLRQYEEVGAA